MAKAKKKLKLEDFVEFTEDLYIAGGNLVGGTHIAKELAPVFFANMLEFDKKNLKTYRSEDWYFMFFIYLMGVSAGEKNAENIRAFTKLIEAKRPIRLQ